MSNSLLTLSSANLKKAAALQARIEHLQAQLRALAGEGASAAPMAKVGGRRPVSAARRKKLSEIAKARWKKAKAAGKTRL
jgi:hypothetical protein